MRPNEYRRCDSRADRSNRKDGNNIVFIARALQIRIKKYRFKSIRRGFILKPAISIMFVKYRKKEKLQHLHKLKLFKL